MYLIDRTKDLILSAGFNVYPRMVEEAILLHPAVAEATVCGVPDPHRGETIKAYVRRHEGALLTAGELRAFLRDKLAPFEQPKAIEFRDELPLTWLGKPRGATWSPKRCGASTRPPRNRLQPVRRPSPNPFRRRERAAGSARTRPRHPTAPDPVPAA